MSSKSAKAALALYLLCGVVAGSFIGQYLGGLPYMAWLHFGEDFVLGPLYLDLVVVKLQFGMTLTVNVSGVIGLFLGLLAYRKL